MCTGVDASLKGVKDGNCNRTACQRSKAVYFNSATRKYYCKSCALLIARACPELDLFKDLFKTKKQVTPKTQ